MTGNRGAVPSEHMAATADRAQLGDLLRDWRRGAG